MMILNLDLVIAKKLDLKIASTAAGNTAHAWMTKLTR